MKLLTLTPEVWVYAVAILVVYSLSCGALTDYLQVRCLGFRRDVYLPLYVGVQAVVAGCALLVLDLPRITQCSWRTAGLALPVGIAAGAVAWWGDAAVKRLLRKRQGRSPQRRRVRTWLQEGDGAGWLRSVQREFKVRRPDHFRLTGGPGPRYAGLGWLLLAGMLEEVLFRGVLVDLVLSLYSPVWIVLCLLATVVVFALSHLSLGYYEVFAKLPLGLVTLLVALLMHSVLPAIIAHGYFNFWAWHGLSQAAAAAPSR